MGDGKSPLVETEDYGFPGMAVANGKVTIADAPAYVLGVVYQDTNGNGLYDVGEGVAGATVTMDDGAYYTVTGASGGYALPLVNADGSYADGAVTVHLSGLPGGGIRDATLTIARVPLTMGLSGSHRANVPWDTVLSPLENPTIPAEDPSHASIAGGGNVVRGGKLTLVVSRPAAQQDRSQPLTLAYTLKGSAVAGVDYQPLSGSLTIPAGKAHAKLTVQALDLPVLNRPPGPWTLQVKLRGVKGTQGKTSITFGP